MRSVSFIHDYGPAFASFRYRAQMPACFINAKLNDPDADIVVLSKPNHVGVAEALKRQGKILVADFCDDHFDHPSLGPITRRIAAIADLCVGPTLTMVDRIPSSRKTLIPDPYELDELTPHADGDRLLWFGHQSNLRDLGNTWKHPALTVVTGPDPVPGAIRWTPQAQADAMAAANVVLLPTRPGAEYKSPNRLLNAVRAGLFPVCHPHPSYTEFMGMAWIGTVAHGIQWANHFRGDLNDRVAELQDHIRDKYSPDTIGKQWQDLLESI